MPTTETKEALKMMALDPAGQLSLQDEYLSLEDFYVMRKDAVSSKTWDFILKSEVDLRTLQYVNPAHNLLKNHFLNLAAKNAETQKEALALWLELFRRTDFLGQNKLWNLMEDTLADNFKHLKNESKRLILRALVSAIPVCLTHHLRGEILIWLLPGECYTGFLSAETPKAWEKVLGFYKLISKKQLILLLSFAEKQGVLGTLKKSFYRTLRWQLYFGAEIPDAQHDKLQMLNEARNLENQNKQLANHDLEKIWQALGDKTAESTAVMIEYLRKDLEKSIDHSAAIPELMSLFCDKS
ncbi:MAG: hypothetical protein PHU71_00310, partial [Candidatus Gracilibacteria bacterium]|nr:hypothetical protein [Candidatus Gracilibacteria bacterium]